MAARAARSRTGRFPAGGTRGTAGTGPAGSLATAGWTPSPERASSVQTRAASISWSYWTPDGHAVMQAMQPRQRSKCSAAVAESSAPSRIWFTR